MLIDFETVRSELARILMVSVDKLNDDADLDNFEDWDSLSRVTLIAYLMDLTKAKVDVDRLDKIKTVADLRQFVSMSSEGLGT